MAAPVGSLVVRVGSDIRGLTRGMKKGGDVVNRFGTVAGRAAKRLSLLTTVSVAAAAAIGVKLTRDGLKAIDSMAKFAKVVGVSTEALAGLQLAAKETAGFTGQNLNLALQRMTRRIAEAAAGSGEAKAAIKELGLSAKELAQAGPHEAFLQIADAMQGVSSQSDRLRLGFKLFDSEGARLVNTLAKGRTEIEGFGKLAEELGLTFSEFDASQVQAANDAIGRVGAVIQGLSRQLAIKLSPFITEFAERLSGAARESGGFGETITDAFKIVIRFGAKLADTFKFVEIGAKTAALAALKVRQALRGQGGLVDVEEIAAGALQIKLLAAEINRVIDGPTNSEAVEEFFRGIEEQAKKTDLAIQSVADGLEVGEPLGRLDSTGVEDDPELKALKEKAATRLEIIRQGLLSEREFANEAFQDKLAGLREAEELELEIEGGFMAAREELEKQHQAELTEIQKREADARGELTAEEWRNRIAATAGFLAQMTSQLAGAAQDNFKLQKALSIASAVLSGIESVIHSYNFGARIGGPVLGATFGAIAAGVQFARIAQISSQKMQRGGGGGAAVSAGPSGGAAAPSGGGGGGGGGSAQAVNISLQGETFGRPQVIDLIENINEAVADGAKLRVV